MESHDRELHRLRRRLRLADTVLRAMRHPDGRELAARTAGA